MQDFPERAKSKGKMAAEYRQTMTPDTFALLLLSFRASGSPLPDLLVYEGKQDLLLRAGS